MENAENLFTPGEPRHLASSMENIRNLRTRRDIQPVRVDSNLQAFVYDSPTDGVSGVKCANKCENDKDCGYKRKCCRTPCGFACFNSIQKIIKL